MLNQKDPQLIVIDEIVGFLVAKFLSPFSLTTLLWSFALFRFFDVISYLARPNRLSPALGLGWAEPLSARVNCRDLPLKREPLHGQLC
jgi:hypothetical protein